MHFEAIVSTVLALPTGTHRNPPELQVGPSPKPYKNILSYIFLQVRIVFGKTVEIDCVCSIMCWFGSELLCLEKATCFYIFDIVSNELLCFSWFSAEHADL